MIVCCSPSLKGSTDKNCHYLELASSARFNGEVNKMNTISLSGLAPEQRPRERLAQLGAEQLSDAELLAILFGHGRPGQCVLQLAEEVAHFLRTRIANPTLQTLQKLPGLGQVRASQVLAILELSRRFLGQTSRIQIRTPKDALPLLASIKSSPQEQFVVVTLDGANQAIATHHVTKGLSNQSQIHARETFHCAIADRAVSILIAHNHPSGRLEASQADLQVTQRLSQAAQMLGIPILDHLIISDTGFTSIREQYPQYFVT